MGVDALGDGGRVGDGGQAVGHGNLGGVVEVTNGGRSALDNERVNAVHPVLVAKRWVDVRDTRQAEAPAGLRAVEAQDVSQRPKEDAHLNDIGIAGRVEVNGANRQLTSAGVVDAGVEVDADGVVGHGNLGGVVEVTNGSARLGGEGTGEGVQRLKRLIAGDARAAVQQHAGGHLATVSVFKVKLDLCVAAVLALQVGGVAQVVEASGDNVVERTSIVGAADEGHEADSLGGGQGHRLSLLSKNTCCGLGSQERFTRIRASRT